MANAMAVIKLVKYLADNNKNTKTGICTNGDKIRKVHKSPGCKGKQNQLHQLELLVDTRYSPWTVNFLYSPYANDRFLPRSQSNTPPSHKCHANRINFETTYVWNRFIYKNQNRWKINYLHYTICKIHRPHSRLQTNRRCKTLTPAAPDSVCAEYLEIFFFTIINVLNLLIDLPRIELFIVQQNHPPTCIVNKFVAFKPVVAKGNRKQNPIQQ